MNLAQLIDPERALAAERPAKTRQLVPPTVRVYVADEMISGRANAPRGQNRPSGIASRVLASLAKLVDGAFAHEIATAAGATRAQAAGALAMLVRQRCAEHRGARKPYTYFVTEKGRARVRAASKA